MGLPGAGKTTLATELAKQLKAVHFNADEIRKKINKDLKFSIEDRMEQARRMGVLCDIVVRAGHFAIADFVCPTEETRRVFNADIIIWVDRIEKGRFEDTNIIFTSPQKFDYRIDISKEYVDWAKIIHLDIMDRMDKLKVL